MLNSAGTKLILALIALSIASEGACAAPLPRFSMPKLSRPSSKPAGPPPRTNNDAGEPISFFDSDSVLDMPVKSTSDTAAKAAKGATIGGTIAAIVGGGAAAGYVASGQADLGYDYAN